jgi:hypothetical protein
MKDDSESEVMRGEGNERMIGTEERIATSAARPARLDGVEEPGESLTIEGLSLRAWKAGLARDLDRSIASAPWPTAFLGVAWIHLVCFAACQAIYDPAIVSDLRHLVLWTVELLAVLALLRGVLGRHWSRSSPAISLVAKLWISFLILSFNVVSLNAVTGFELSWFKPVWATLSAFLFAALAWLFTPLFFIPAVQMWLTGLLMVHLPAWCYLIYGVSWWLALVGIAVYLRWKKASLGA